MTMVVTKVRPRYVQCARGAELQAAREAAGMTHEDVARRMIIVKHLQNPHRNRGRRPDEFTGLTATKTLPFYTREVARLERTSQDAFDRAAAESARRERDMDYCKSLKRTPWRPFPSKFDAPLRAIALGHQNATLDELRDAVAAAGASDQTARVEARTRDLTRLGSGLAALVWNSADREFLDLALAAELREHSDSGYMDVRNVVRFALGILADELRVTYPERAPMELPEVER